MGGPLATTAGRGQSNSGGVLGSDLGLNPKKLGGQRQGSNSNHDLSPLDHIAPILAPFVIP